MLLLFHIGTQWSCCVQMGEAAGMLFQDELVVKAAYEATTPETFLDMLDVRINKLTVCDDCVPDLI